MKWIGQHIYDLISRFRSDVYLEDVSTGTIASGGNLGLDSNNKIVKATTASGDLTSIVAGTGLSGTSLTGPIPTLNVDASQTQITSIGTDGDTLQILSDAIQMVNTTTSKPEILLSNYTDDATGPFLKFFNRRLDSSFQDGEDNDVLGTLEFWGYDDGTPTLQRYASIYADIHDATSGEESGRLSLQVANHDGGVGSGLILTGGSADSEIDVTLGLGANSVVTIPGGLSLGTNLPTDQQKHLMHYQLAGYGQGDGTNYEVTQNINDTNAPFEHNTNVGSDGTTAITVANMSRTGGHVMPRACTLKRWTGWGTCAGSQTVYIGLFKASFTRNDSTNLSLVLLDEFSYTAMGNNKVEDFDETSFSAADLAAGDMIITAIKSQSGYTQYFNSTVEVEF